MKPTTPTSIYDRNESLDTRYFGGQLGASISKKISSDLLLDVGNDVSLLKMKGNYYGTDVHYAGGGSTVTHSLNKTAYSAHCSIGIRYVKTSGVFLGWAVIFIILAVSLQLFMRREQREMEPTSHHH